MNYQVIYESQSGNTARLAKEIAACFPERRTKLIDINTQQPTLNADAYCVGFCVHYGICSMKMVELLKHLSGKAVLLFATCGTKPTRVYHNVLERNIVPFLPAGCDYRGLFLCQGAINEDGLAALKRQFESSGDEETLQQLEALRIGSRSHPDETDFLTARNFATNRLGTAEQRML